MKFCQISLKGILLIFCLTFLPEAFAQTPDTLVEIPEPLVETPEAQTPETVAQTEVAMPPVGDYVLRFTTTNTREKDFYSVSADETTLVGDPNSYTSANVSAQTLENNKSFTIKIIVYANPITLAARVGYWEIMDGVLPFKFHETGFNEALGQETYFQYLSYTKGFVDGEYTDVSFKNPTGLMYVALYDERVILEVEYQKEDEVLTDEDIAALNEFVKTISVTYEDIFDTAETTYVYSSPNLMLHLSPGKFTKASGELLVPKDWIVEEISLIEATPEQREGRIILDLAPYEELVPGEASENLRVNLIGLPEQTLKASVYQAAGASALAEVIQSPIKVSSKDITEDMEEFMFGAHCLADYKGSPNSGGVTATTYEGLNSDGLPIKALHVSAGGYYLACNYIYTASPDRFDVNVDFVMDILKGLRVDFLGPPLKR